jgi:uncharacterized protein (DUF2147 family)
MTMPRSAKYAFIAAMVAAVTATSLHAQDLTPVGVWLHPSKRFEVEIGSCGEELCGRIIWLKSPENAQGQPRTDHENANAALRTRPLLGLTVLQGLRPTGERTWGDGAIYDPDDGSDYKATVKLDDDGTLAVHAYAVTPIFGKTIVFTRAS